ncbi:MAG: hypothetical protein FRX49_10300 [Trebouxia sp. A1-2]|nr:MAG: hypothetical protein FRX49_10300 [Trebouxia sp. A1-2]
MVRSSLVKSRGDVAETKRRISVALERYGAFAGAIRRADVSAQISGAKVLENLASIAVLDQLLLRNSADLRRFFATALGKADLAAFLRSPSASVQLAALRASNALAQHVETLPSASLPWIVRLLQGPDDGRGNEVLVTKVEAWTQGGSSAASHLRLLCSLLQSSLAAQRQLFEQPSQAGRMKWRDADSLAVLAGTACNLLDTVACIVPPHVRCQKVSRQGACQTADTQASQNGECDVLPALVKALQPLLSQKREGVQMHSPRHRVLAAALKATCVLLLPPHFDHGSAAKSSPWLSALSPTLPSQLIGLLSKDGTDHAVDTWCWQALYLLQAQLSASQIEQILQHPAAHRIPPTSILTLDPLYCSYSTLRVVLACKGATRHAAMLRHFCQPPSSPSSCQQAVHSAIPQGQASLCSSAFQSQAERQWPQHASQGHRHHLLLPKALPQGNLSRYFDLACITAGLRCLAGQQDAWQDAWLVLNHALGHHAQEDGAAWTPAIIASLQALTEAGATACLPPHICQGLLQLAHTPPTASSSCTVTAAMSGEVAYGDINGIGGGKGSLVPQPLQQQENSQLQLWWAVATAACCGRLGLPSELGETMRNLLQLAALAAASRPVAAARFAPMDLRSIAPFGPTCIPWDSFLSQEECDQLQAQLQQQPQADGCILDTEAVFEATDAAETGSDEETVNCQRHPALGICTHTTREVQLPITIPAPAHAPLHVDLLLVPGRSCYGRPGCANKARSGSHHEHLQAVPTIVDVDGDTQEQASIHDGHCSCCTIAATCQQGLQGLSAHRAVLAASSPYFAAMLSDRWQAGTQSEQIKAQQHGSRRLLVARLPTQDMEVLFAFVHFCYTPPLPKLTDLDQEGQKQADAPQPQEMSTNLLVSTGSNLPSPGGQQGDEQFGTGVFAQLNIVHVKYRGFFVERFQCCCHPLREYTVKPCVRDFGEIPTDHEFDNGELTLVMDDCNPGTRCLCLPGFYKRLTITAKEQQVELYTGEAKRLPHCLFALALQLHDPVSPQGGVLGYAQQVTKCCNCSGFIEVLDASNQVMYTIQEPCCQGCAFSCCLPNLCCKRNRLSIHPANSHDTVGEIVHTFPGCSKSCCTSSSNFFVSFPPAATPDQKAMIMAAAFLANYLYFRSAL